MIGIVFATRSEADPLLDMIGASVNAVRPFDIFTACGTASRSIKILISGMGKVAAAAAASHLILAHQATTLISAGICGRLTGEAAVGDCFRIAEAIEGDSERLGRRLPAVACDPSWFRQLPAKRLVTCDRPVFDPHRRADLGRLGELVDMEGAAIARVAGLYGIPCAMLKGVSDGAGAGGRQDLATNLGRVSARIAHVLTDGLTRIFTNGS